MKGGRQQSWWVDRSIAAEKELRALHLAVGSSVAQRRSSVDVGRVNLEAKYMCNSLL